MEKGTGTLHTLEELERMLAEGETLDSEQLERLEQARRELGQQVLGGSDLSGRELADNSAVGGQAGRGLGDSMGSGILARGLTDKDDGSGFYARLLKEPPLERGLFGRILPVIPLARFFEGYTLSSGLGLEREDSKLGFVVSPVDGWITIGDQKPFRYLSPIRLYRIRSSVVAVTNEEEVGSGLVISPSLVLTNYEIAKNNLC